MVIAFEKNFPEVILGLITIAYGAMLSFPPDSFQYAEGYGIITGFMPAWIWGLLFLILGIVNLGAILTRHGDTVRFTAKLLFFLWFLSAFMFAWAAIFAPGWIMMFGVAVLFGGVSSEYRTKSKWYSEQDLPGLDR